MTDLSNAAEILKRAQQQQNAEAAKKPKTATHIVTSGMQVNKKDVPVYTMTAPSGKVVQMMEDDVAAGKAVVIEE